MRIKNVQQKLYCLEIVKTQNQIRLDMHKLWHLYLRLYDRTLVLVTVSTLLSLAHNLR